MEERTMTFSINGDFITRLAREKCHYEGKIKHTDERSEDTWQQEKSR